MRGSQREKENRGRPLPGWRGSRVGALSRYGEYWGSFFVSTKSAGLRVVVVLDTAGFLGALPLSGAAARTLGLNRHLHAMGSLTTLLLCDLNPRSRRSDSWPMPVQHVTYEQLYEQPDTIMGLVRELAPNVLVMSTTQLVVRYGRALADSVGAALVYEMHDDEAALLRSIGQSGAELREAGLLQAAAIAAADGVITFTARDARQAAALGARSVYVVPCGVETIPPPDAYLRTDNSVAFVGNLFYAPNMRAVRYLSRALAPSLARPVRIDVYGRHPRRARQLGKHRVRLHGPVARLRTALSMATVGVAPLDSGGGMKLKVLEYLAAELPVVGTKEAFVGFDHPERFALVSVDDMDDVPSLVNTLLNDAALRRELGGRGRRLVERRYSWQAMAVLARRAYGAILDAGRAGAGDVSPEVAALASAPPYWLREWQSQQRTNKEGREVAVSPMGVEASLAEAIDCARLAAESALDTTFDSDAIVGFAGRSMVFLGTGSVLKIYTHRWSERLQREMAGLRAAATLPDVRIPVVLGHDDVPGSLAWVCCTRLAGTSATGERWQNDDTTTLIGRLGAQLHSIPVESLADLPAYRRNIRDLPTEYPDAYQAGSRLADALAAIEHNSRRACVHGLVHGDFSSRNILLESGLPPAVIDFEGAGRGCVYEDLATLTVKEVLLGDRSEAAWLAGYANELATHDDRRTGLDEPHLYFHIAWYARWVLQWAPEVDQPFAAQIIELVPHILNRILAGPPGRDRGRRRPRRGQNHRARLVTHHTP